jgi:hypothetical protein
VFIESNSVALQMMEARLTDLEIRRSCTETGDWGVSLWTERLATHDREGYACR